MYSTLLYSGSQKPFSTLLLAIYSMILSTSPSPLLLYNLGAILIRSFNSLIASHDLPLVTTSIPSSIRHLSLLISTCHTLSDNPLSSRRLWFHSMEVLLYKCSSTNHSNLPENPSKHNLHYYHHQANLYRCFQEYSTCSRNKSPSRRMLSPLLLILYPLFIGKAHLNLTKIIFKFEFQTKIRDVT